MRTLRVVVALAAVTFLFCAKKQTVQPPPGDKLLWTSESARPDWAYETPKATGGEHIVVGMSYKYADEKSCRDDAEANRVRVSRKIGDDSVPSQARTLWQAVAGVKLLPDGIRSKALRV